LWALCFTTTDDTLYIIQSPLFVQPEQQQQVYISSSQHKTKTQFGFRTLKAEDRQTDKGIQLNTTHVSLEKQSLQSTLYMHNQ